MFSSTVGSARAVPILAVIRAVGVVRAVEEIPAGGGVPRGRLGGGSLGVGILGAVGVVLGQSGADVRAGFGHHPVDEERAEAEDGDDVRR